MAVEQDQIKKPGLPMIMTEHEEEEWIKCGRDPIYFIENYVKVIHPLKGPVPMKLYPYQKECVEAFQGNRKTILLAARQLGKCVSADTLINKDGKQIEIGKLIYDNLSLYKKIIYYKDRLVQSILNKIYL